MAQHFSEITKCEAVELHQSGISVPHIAARFHATTQIVNYWIRAWKKRGGHKVQYSVEMDCIEQKCNECNEYWPLDNEFWRKKNTAKSGYDFTCRACRVENENLTN